MRAQCDPFELEFTDNNRPFLGVGSFLMQEIQVYKKTLLALYLPAAPSSIPAGCQQQQRLLSLSDAASLTELEGSVERGRLFDCRWEQSRTVEDDSIHTHTHPCSRCCFGPLKDSIGSKGKGDGGERMNVQDIHGYMPTFFTALFYK